MSGRIDYEERKEARIERLNSAATNAAERSNQLYKESDNMMAAIPMGQPIITGRGSRTTADINYRNRAWNKLGKSVDESNKAEYYAGKIEAAESNKAISSDDPTAIEKLRDKITNLEVIQLNMKKVNTYYRKYKTCKGCEGVTDEQAQKLDDSMTKAYSWVTAPYPSFELTSVNNMIKAAKERIEHLQKLDTIPAADDIVFEGGRIVDNIESNRIQIIYDERPGDEVISKLRSYGFHWSHANMAWQRLRNTHAMYAAKQVIAK